MIDKRLIKIQKTIQRQHADGLASDDSLAEINAVVARAKNEDLKRRTDTLANKAETGDNLSDQPQRVETVHRGSWVRQIREREKLSQRELADYLYMSANSIQKWERDVSQPTGAAYRLLMLIEEKGISVLA